MYYSDIRPQFKEALKSKGITMYRFGTDRGKSKSLVSKVAAGVSRSDSFRRGIELVVREYNPGLLDHNTWYVARYMAEAGHTELADCFSGPKYQTLELGTSFANGTLDDEISDMTELLGKAREAHRKGRGDSIRKIVSDAHSILERVTAESDRL